MTESLPVWWGEERVGELDRGGDGRIYFAYDESWLDHEDAAPVSLSLPLTDEFYQEPAHRWFSNLLPEGAAREAVARSLGVSEDDDFGLLALLGRDVAGALSLGETHQARGTWEPLDAEDLDQWSQGVPALPAEAADGVRLSLAGAQHKIGARYSDGQYTHTRGGGASTHILKFCPRDLAHVPANEFLMLELARALGLPVARSRLELRWSKPVLAVERFDRIQHGGEVKRLHQEDVCQALGVSRIDKYRTLFTQAYDLVGRASSSPARDVRSLLGWQVFNVICGNDDGHAKNLTLSLEGGARLAPFYDLVCTAAIARVSRKLAMPVGGTRDSGNIAAARWREEEQTLGLRRGALTRIVEAQLADLPRALDVACEVLASEIPDSPVLQRVPAAIRKRVRRVENGLVGTAE